MDNITHTLTGALAARAVSGSRQESRRTLFWLLLVAANFPDIDVALRFVTDPLTALEYHRGVTHSFLAAPLVALVPALLFRLFGKVKRLLLLWFAAWIGICVHIFFDLVTPFGTQIFLPISTERYSLDWMFIIDPLFTLLLGAGLWASRRKWIVQDIVFAVIAGYLALEAVAHGTAVSRVAEYARSRGIASEQISALPQPLNIFRWSGIIQADDGVHTMFFSLSDDTVSSTAHPHARSALAGQAKKTPEGRWYLSYARHPWIREVQEGDATVVEFRDLQFAIDPAFARRFGMTPGELPFTLRFVYTREGRLGEVRFNRDVLRHGDEG